MILIIQIAFGIVLGFLILNFISEILGFIKYSAIISSVIITALLALYLLFMGFDTLFESTDMSLSVDLFGFAALVIILFSVLKPMFNWLVSFIKKTFISKSLDD